MEPLTGETLYAIVCRLHDDDRPSWQDLDEDTRDAYEQAAQAINEQRYVVQDHQEDKQEKGRHQT